MNPRMTVCNTVALPDLAMLLSPEVVCRRSAGRVLSQPPTLAVLTGLRPCATPRNRTWIYGFSIRHLDQLGQSGMRPTYPQPVYVQAEAIALHSPWVSGEPIARLVEVAGIEPASVKPFRVPDDHSRLVYRAAGSLYPTFVSARSGSGQTPFPRLSVVSVR